MSSTLPELYSVFLPHDHRLKENFPTSKTKLKPTRESIINKRLTRILNQKMFKGFNKTKKLCYLAKNPIRQNPNMQSPLHLWEEYEPYPFEEYFNVTYKQKFLSKLNGPNLSKLYHIKHYPTSQTPSNNDNHHTNIMNNLYLTASRNLKNNTTVNKSTNTYNHTEPTVIDKIFPNKNEINNYSSLHFFALDKNPIDIDYHSYNNYVHNTHHVKKDVKGDHNERNHYMDAEFLYKISHPYKEDEKIVNNFSKNKAVKKGLTTNDFYHGPPSKFDKRSNSNNVQLKLNVENVTNGNAVSQKYVTNEEKKMLFVEKNVNMLKDNFDMLNKFENELFADDVSEHHNNNNTNVVNNTQSSSCNNVMSEDNSNTLRDDKANINNMKELSHIIKQAKTNRTSMFNDVNINNNNYISTEASLKHKYISNKDQQHKNRFNYIKQLAFTQDNNSSNSKTPPYKNSISLKAFRNRSLYRNNEDSTLFKQAMISHKIQEEKTSRHRDNQISIKLQPYYSKNDIKRILNGKHPFVVE